MRVPAESRLHYLFVLPRHVARTFSREAASKTRQTVALRFDVELVRERQQTGRSAFCDKSSMKIVVSPLHRKHVGPVRNSIALRQTFGLQTESVESGDNGGLPVVAALTHRTAQRLALYENSSFRRVIHLLTRQWRDRKPAQSRRDNKTFRLQPRERLAEG